MVWIELCILVGARLGRIGLGTVAGLGLVVFVSVIGLPTGMPPRTVLGMIVAVVTATATMQAAGGLSYLAALADRSLRVWPGGITIVAPIVTYIATFSAGTVHITYALLPVIAEVSRKGRGPARAPAVDRNRRIAAGDHSLSDFSCNHSLAGTTHATRCALAADSSDLCAFNVTRQLSRCNCGLAKGT